MSSETIPNESECIVLAAIVANYSLASQLQTMEHTIGQYAQVAADRCTRAAQQTPFVADGITASLDDSYRSVYRTVHGMLAVLGKYALEMGDELARAQQQQQLLMQQRPTQQQDEPADNGPQTPLNSPVRPPRPEAVAPNAPARVNLPRSLFASPDTAFAPFRANSADRAAARMANMAITADEK